MTRLIQLSLLLVAVQTALPTASGRITEPRKNDRDVRASEWGQASTGRESGNLESLMDEEDEDFWGRALQASMSMPSGLGRPTVPTPTSPSAPTPTTPSVPTPTMPSVPAPTMPSVPTASTAPARAPVTAPAGPTSPSAPSPSAPSPSGPSPSAPSPSAPSPSAPSPSGPSPSEPLPAPSPSEPSPDAPRAASSAAALSTKIMLVAGLAWLTI